MIFKNVAYRLGYGKNINGNNLGEQFIVYYKSRDGVVDSKIITRRAGHVELKKGNQKFNATTVIPFKEGFVMTRVDKEIKSQKREEN